LLIVLVQRAHLFSFFLRLCRLPLQLLRPMTLVCQLQLG
jgi:hypothetical protein